MRNLLVFTSISALLACSPLSNRCEADAGEATHEVQFRIVNLGRETVTVTLEGEEKGQPVLPMQSLAKTGHVTLIKQRGTVQARQFAADGTKTPVSLPFEFDTTTGEPVSFVVVDTMPNRISMNVTVAKQTQGATFGEKVNAGLALVELEGGVDTDGDCVADFGAPAGTMAAVGLRGDGDTSNCPNTADREFSRPAEADVEATPYFVHGKNGELQVAWVGRVNAGLHAAGGAIGQGASLLGGALPGGAVISAAVSSFYVLNAGPTPATVSLEGVEVARLVSPGSLVRVTPSSVSSAIRRSVDESGRSRGVIAGIVVGAVISTVELGSIDEEDTLLVISENLTSSATVLRSKHDSRKSVLNTIRRTIAFSTTSNLETKGCVAVLPTDDTCVMGAAIVGGGPGSAAQASYAATGMVLYPPATPPAQGTSMRFVVEESGIVARRFVWASPAGLTPVTDKAPGGFAIVGSGPGVDQRTLFFVDTTVSPWAVQASLSR
ncbi:MAG: hypothetical protein Q8N23_10495 [Archangium sp.]|nr:hypothetical protein [Archangium sp.]MDP3572223.1 hypothetical protein [Archangium sp.]